MQDDACSNKHDYTKQPSTFSETLSVLPAALQTMIAVVGAFGAIEFLGEWVRILFETWSGWTRAFWGALLVKMPPVSADGKDLLTAVSFFLFMLASSVCYWWRQRLTYEICVRSFLEAFAIALVAVMILGPEPLHETDSADEVLAFFSGRLGVVLVVLVALVVTLVQSTWFACLSYFVHSMVSSQRPNFLSHFVFSSLAVFFMPVLIGFSVHSATFSDIVEFASTWILAQSLFLTAILHPRRLHRYFAIFLLLTSVAGASILLEEAKEFIRTPPVAGDRLH